MDSALMPGDVKPRSGIWKQILAILPGIGMALMPKVVCPACWPLYAAALSALGIGFIPSARYLMPLTMLFLAIALLVLYADGRKRGRKLPALVGVGAATIILAGKFMLQSSAWLHVGLGLFIATFIWNGWPGRRTRSCGSCCSNQTGKLADCCTGRGPNETSLRAAGIGVAL